jgi:uncharacterized protein YmfQ (DUF2313 family)
MPLLSYSAQDYLAQFQRLLPRGRVWHRGLELLQDFDLLTLMPTWSRLQDALNTLIAEIFPCTTHALLPEWEETLGLPDPCTGSLGNWKEQQQAVCIKFSARGGQSKAYYIGIAEQLGYEITITEFAPFRAGINRAGDPDYGEGWAHTWRITAVAPMNYFRAGNSDAGDRLRTWGSRLFECTWIRSSRRIPSCCLATHNRCGRPHERGQKGLGHAEGVRVEHGARPLGQGTFSHCRAADRPDPRPGDLRDRSTAAGDDRAAGQRIEGGRGWFGGATMTPR